MHDFRGFFSEAMGDSVVPYPYQERLAQEVLPDVLHVPTGLGKTAAVTLGWLYRRKVMKDSAVPRRLVWCLPMRVLAEQTLSNIETWLRRLQLLGQPGEGKISIHLLMGGEAELRTAHWSHYPEEEAILVGTQDMFLSRALMRGYSMSRYQWPVHFALLHNDALWVFDEVQLMGTALPTSAQLEAFRRKGETARPTLSLWVSATLRSDWLKTVDFRRHVEQLSVAALSDEDRRDSSVQRRLSASKTLISASTRLDAENSKQKSKSYITDLASEILEVRDSSSQTLVILNRVDRAQALYRELTQALPEADVLLLHARFRPRDRAIIEVRLKDESAAAGRIIVATQAVEAGVDVSSHILFTELAPWASLVQRFGRCNRGGEYPQAEVRWIDIEDSAGQAAPYEEEDLLKAREILLSLDSASPAALPPVFRDERDSHVLRSRDFLELFNTDPDLSGFDIDVSPYIRDRGSPQCQVFWRDFDAQPVDQDGPSRDELCPAGLGQVSEYLKKSGRAAWTWDPLHGEWQGASRDHLRPGMILLLRARDGGYLPESGFNPEEKKKVEVLPDGQSDEDRYPGDPLAVGRYLSLREHLQHVVREVERIAEDLGLGDDMRNVLIEAGRWHDVGKAHPAFQGMLLNDFQEDDVRRQTLWAKSPGKGRAQYRVPNSDGEVVERRYFRHELASMLAWLEHGSWGGLEEDLVAYLIAAHHGKVRLGLRSLPTETMPPEKDRLYARGVWDGDELPPMRLNGTEIGKTVLHLDLMQLGEGPQGPSWTFRTQRLLQQYGPFQLAWLEALVRIADWRASKAEQASDTEGESNG